METIIYTDGACVPNPGAGGWAFVVYRDGEEIHEEHGGQADTTNNLMELTGMLKALEWLRDPANRTLALIRCDSRYVVNGCNIWRLGWEKNGWRKGKAGGYRRGQIPKADHNAAIANLATWQAIAKVIDSAPVLPVKIEWVKGHAGIAGNERADELTMMAAAQAAGVSVEELYDMEARMRRAWKGAA